MGEHTHKMAQNTPEEAQAKLRKFIIDTGVVTPEQATAVTFELVDPTQHPEIPRCACPDCKHSSSFMAFGIDQERVSPLQFRLIVEAYNVLVGPFIPASPDPSKWVKKAQ